MATPHLGYWLSLEEAQQTKVEFGQEVLLRHLEHLEVAVSCLLLLEPPMHAQEMAGHWYDPWCCHQSGFLDLIYQAPPLTHRGGSVFARGLHCSCGLSFVAFGDVRPCSDLRYQSA